MTARRSWQRDRVGSALRGENPMVIARLRAGFAVIGDTQHLPGYCVLLTDEPAADHLSDLPPARRTEFLVDMALLGEAIERACSPRRVNYEILGNAEPFLHAHVCPRYEWESEEYASRPVWRYPAEIREAPEHAYDAGRHGALRAEIASALRQLAA